MRFIRKIRECAGYEQASSYSNYLKEDLRLFWQQISKEKTESLLKKRLEQADNSGVKHVKQIANTIRLYQWGI